MLFHHNGAVVTITGEFSTIAPTTFQFCRLLKTDSMASFHAPGRPRPSLIVTTLYRSWFVWNYAAIAGPLTDLVKPNAFCWSRAASEAFSALKQAIMMPPVLALPDFPTPFEMSTDAFGFAVGAVLTQLGHPIAYISKKLSPRMIVASAYVWELYAITEAVKK
ncbi:Retrovirus-related Pol polyprotein from transposon [Sesamum alatum]|uniref:Retrovirus-related Pol polyprotein from transposon n=1 Tax=Sesamum alatum TaxID=300844 RepID=A0AAE1YFP7_9LAMI|nr:Retrovirus-related Pol polyprotein from transposon [Sesamum alatum]